MDPDPDRRHHGLRAGGPAGVLAETFEAEQRLFIKSGDAGAVSVEINGQDAGALGAAGRSSPGDYTLKTAS